MTKKSAVYAMRLNPNDQDEQRAIEFLEERLKAGYETKQVLLPLILKEMGTQPVTPQYMAQQTQELLVSVDELRQVLAELQTGQRPIIPQTPLQDDTDEAIIKEDDPMLQSLMKRARPGLRQE